MSNQTSKKAKESKTIMTQVVQPDDTNPLGDLRGGKLLHWMDLCSAISAQKHCNRNVVTASVDNVSFQKPIKLGNVVTIQSKVTRAFRTSMEVAINVWGENIPEQERYKTNKAYYSFVAIGQDNTPIPVPDLIPETDKEKQLYRGASKRKELRLILSNKMKPEEAEELRALFREDFDEDLL